MQAVTECWQGCEGQKNNTAKQNTKKSQNMGGREAIRGGRVVEVADQQRWHQNTQKVKVAERSEVAERHWHRQERTAVENGVASKQTAL